MSDGDNTQNTDVQPGGAVPATAGAAPFQIDEVCRTEGVVTVVVRRDIIGPMANQLKGTSPKRTRHNVLRKMGHMLAAAGNILYGDDPSKYPELASVVEV